jgi:hypothetical protein
MQVSFPTKLSALTLKGFNSNSGFVFLSARVVIDGAAILRLHWQLGWPLRDDLPHDTHTHTQWHATTHLSPPRFHPLQAARVPYPITPNPAPYISLTRPASYPSFLVVKHKNRISEFICFPWPLLTPFLLGKCREFNLNAVHIRLRGYIKEFSTEMCDITWKKC